MTLTCWGLGPAEPEDRLGPTEEINEVLGEVGADPVLESILSWRIEAMPKSNGLDTVADIPEDPEDSAEPTGESWKKNEIIIRIEILKNYYISFKYGMVNENCAKLEFFGSNYQTTWSTIR